MPRQGPNRPGAGGFDYPLVFAPLRDRRLTAAIDKAEMLSSGWPNLGDTTRPGAFAEKAAVSAVARHLRQQAHDGSPTDMRTDDLEQLARRRLPSSYTANGARTRWIWRIATAAVRRSSTWAEPAFRCSFRCNSAAFPLLRSAGNFVQRP